MYYLMFINKRENNNSVFNHPLVCMYASKDINSVLTCMRNKILDGYQESSFMVMEKVGVSVNVNVYVDRAKD